MGKRLKYNLGANDLQEAEEWLKKCFSCKHQYCTKDNPDEIKCNVKKCKYEKEQKGEKHELD